MKITIFGLGYVGLVSAACLAEVGHQLLCVDIDAEKVSQLQSGDIPIYEPGLADLVNRNYLAERLQFTTDIAAAVAHAEVQLIAVGTPPQADGSVDLSYVLTVAANIAEHMQSPKIIVNKSTVPVGTAAKVKQLVDNRLTQRQQQLECAVASNPEFLKEGNAVNDFMRPDRIIIGADCERAELLLKQLYQPFNRNHDRVMVMDVVSAELTKYAANAMLATKISFINEVANIAERLGADIEQVRLGIGSDPRIGYDFIYPGCGYGGSCFPKDVRALIHTADQVGQPATLLQAVDAVNDQQKQRLFAKVFNHYAGDLSGKTFALWGLAFKPNTDDVREASSVTLVRALQRAGAKVQAFDPEASECFQKAYPDCQNISVMPTQEQVLAQADALIICTEWQTFRAPEFTQIKQILVQPVIFDGRNLYDPNVLKQQGFTYYAIGRGEHIDISIAADNVNQGQDNSLEQPLEEYS